ncbi:hypothetical protein M011DRAFT_46083 [Sporormia fimetaria CBS 119925]|uniref:Uncharacterized protein n=1 Tax=Sporormia fimetaria CBS 119925 TaxID=1340428 RepID=A0A6A6VAD9_9PLEO|nr:hypothetical protein M011DRAFT_46083 [Sporormia fimetaria CBS 119925]
MKSKGVRPRLCSLSLLPSQNRAQPRSISHNGEVTPAGTDTRIAAGSEPCPGDLWEISPLPCSCCCAVRRAYRELRRVQNLSMFGSKGKQEIRTLPCRATPLIVRSA